MIRVSADEDLEKPETRVSISARFGFRSSRARQRPRGRVCPGSSRDFGRVLSGTALRSPLSTTRSPLLLVEWHEGHGFVIRCYEDEDAWGGFLLTGARCGPPTIDTNLVGQALE